MGTWHPEIVPVSLWQTWHPQYPGDWPRYADEHTPSMSEGVIPPPCPTCGGLVKRRQLVSNLSEIRDVEASNGRDARRAALLKQPAPTPRPVPDPIAIWHYDLLHFRRCSGEPLATPARDGLGSLDEAIAKSAFDPKQLRIVDAQQSGGAA